jgi:hypothetical protein
MLQAFVLQQHFSFVPFYLPTVTNRPCHRPAPCPRFDSRRIERSGRLIQASKAIRDVANNGALPSAGRNRCVQRHGNLVARREVPRSWFSDSNHHDGFRTDTTSHKAVFSGSKCICDFVPGVIDAFRCVSPSSHVSNRDEVRIG